MLLKSLCKTALLLLLPIVLGGCATSSVLTPYPYTANAYRASLEAGDPASGISNIGDKLESADGLLYALEKGRLAQLAGNADESRKSFDAALHRFAQQDDKAVISASSYAASGASLLTNENARPYHGRAYERIFLHQYQALNYLANGDSEGALVEVRRANQVQNEALARKENKVDNARNDAAKQGFDENRYGNYFSPMDLAAGRVKSEFQNAATFYLSGLIYEATGNTNDAYIDYRKALEIAPQNDYLKKDVLRTGLKAGMDDVQKLARQVQGSQLGPKAGEGELVIYLEEGYAPVKQPLSIPIWTMRTTNNVSFPIYNNAPAPSPMTVYVNGQALESSVLVDTRALAVRTLKDEVPGLLARAFLRLMAKQEMQRRAQNNDSSGLLGLASTLYSLVIEQPDLRSWLTLPGSGQILRVSLPAGEHKVWLPGQLPISVTVRAGRPTLAHLTIVGAKSYAQKYPL